MTIERTLAILFPDGIAEVCAIGKTGRVGGFFRDHAAAARAVEKADASKPKGIYCTLNPVDDLLYARSPESIGASDLTKDIDVVRRRWILVDFDPVRPSDVSSTSDEHDAARTKAADVAEWLRGHGTGEPILADSGNGYHLLIPVDLPNNVESKALVNNFLKAVKQHHQDEFVEVDTKVGNAARITKLYGTRTRKGEETDERPHRYSKLANVPDYLQNGWRDPTSADVLQVVADKFADDSNGDDKHTPPPVTQVESSLLFSPISNDNAVSRCQQYLEKIGNSVQGQNGSDRMLQAAAETQRFGLSDGDATSILNWFNGAKCTPPWTDKDIQHKLESAKKKVAESGEHGCRLREGYQQASVNDLVEPDEDDELFDDVHEDPGAMPSELFDCPGFIGQWFEHLEESAVVRQPTLNFAASLSLTATLVGRSVYETLGNRSNLLIVNLAETGRGKNHAITKTKKLLDAVGRSAFYSDEFSSGAALARGLSVSPNKLWICDEFGKQMQNINSPTAGSYLREIEGLLLKTYSQAGQSVTKEYADPAYNIKIESPCLNFIGMATPSSFFLSLTPQSVSDGLIPRMLFFIGEPNPKSNEVSRLFEQPKDLPQSVLYAAQELLGRRETNGNLADLPTGDICPHPVVFEHDAASESAWIAFHKACLKRKEAIWSRAAEKATRLALVRACSRNFDEHTIRGEDMEWAIKLVTWNTELVLNQVSQNIADGVHEAKKKRALALVRESGRLTRSQFTRKTQWIRDAKERNGILNDLREAGFISIESVQSGAGKPTQFIVYKRG